MDTVGVESATAEKGIDSHSAEGHAAGETGKEQDEEVGVELPAAD